MRPQTRLAGKEFSYNTFSPLGLDLCFDLRVRHEHTVTFPFSQEPPEVQNAIDRQIVHYYNPDSPRNTDLIERILRGDRRTHAIDLLGDCQQS